MCFTQRRLLSGKKQLIINCIKPSEKWLTTPGNAFLGHSCQASPSLNTLIFFFLVTSIFWKARLLLEGETNHKPAAASTLLQRWVSSCSCYPLKSSPKPQITSLSLYWYSASSIWQHWWPLQHDKGQNEGIASSLNSESSKALDTSCWLSSQKCSW